MSLARQRSGDFLLQQFGSEFPDDIKSARHAADGGVGKLLDTMKQTFRLPAALRSGQGEKPPTGPSGNSLVTSPVTITGSFLLVPVMGQFLLQLQLFSLIKNAGSLCTRSPATRRCRQLAISSRW